MKNTKTTDEIVHIIVNRAARNEAQINLNEILYLHRFKTFHGEMPNEEANEYSRAQNRRAIIAAEYVAILAEIFGESYGVIKHAIEEEAEKQYGQRIRGYRDNPEQDYEDNLLFLSREYHYE